MRLFYKSKLTKQGFILMAVQMLLLLAALLSFLIHRGNLFRKDFTLSEYIVSENTRVVEDVTTDETMNGGGTFVRTPDITLDKGTYSIYVNYNANAADNSAHAESAQLGTLDIRCPDIALNPAYHTAVLSLDLAREVTDFTVSAHFSGKGYLSITGISIIENTDHYKRNMVRAFLLCLLLDLFYLFRKSDTSSRRIILALAAIFGITCYPLYVDYLIAGHDIPFHLLRIEGLAKGLSDHVFPVKIHPVWARDHGYAVGVMYGNAFLYFPALLRRFGYSVQSAYKLYVAAVNLGTVVVSYFTFKRMFRSKLIGLSGCLIYSLSIYRLVDTYTRAAVGEYTAMLFFPVLLCGFYLIFTEAAKGTWQKPAILTALGISGLIQSHVLSCEMAAFVILPICLILIRRVCRRYTFTALASAAFLAVLLNLGFLVPFLDYYGSGLFITSEQWAGSTIGFFQENGLFPVQLFTLFGHATGSAWQIQGGVSNEATITMGISFLLGLLLFFYLLLCHGKECRACGNFIPACVCTTFGCLLLYMSTCYFPWDAVASLGEPAKDLIYSMEFPWRLLAPATALLTFSCCFSMSAFRHICGKTAAYPVLLSMLALLAVNCGWFLYDYTFSAEPYHVYATYELDSMTMYSYDYLPRDTSPENITDNRIIQEGITALTSYEKQGTKILCGVTAEDSGGYIDFPLNYYKYYTCRDISTGDELEVSPGYNSMLRVTFPAGYSGNVIVTFQEPLHWRASELLSLLAFLGLGCYLLYLRYRSALPAKAQRSSQAPHSGTAR